MSLKFVFLCIFWFGTEYLGETHKLQEPKETTHDIVPFHAKIHDGKVKGCNGILITENFVITPAYCVYGIAHVTIFLGFDGSPYHTPHDSEQDIQILESSHIFIHEDFAKIDDQHYLNNIALIKLSTPATLSDKVRPGKLMSREDALFVEGRTAEVGGWTDRNFKLAPVQIRNQDTCDYLFGGQFLRSQELCIRWLELSSFGQGGNAVIVDDKIIGYQTNTPQCTEAGLGCTQNDKILNFAPFLDWLSHKMNVSIGDFTKSESKHCCHNQDLMKIEHLVHEINETLATNLKKYDGEIANIHIKIENIQIELQRTNVERINFALALNEQLNSIRTEINNSRIEVNQNVFKLQEDLNGVRTEVSNGLSAQKSLSDSESRLIEMNNDIQFKVNEQTEKLEDQVKALATKVTKIEMTENEHFSLHSEEIASLRIDLNEISLREVRHGDAIDRQFAIINSTLKNVSNIQNSLQVEIENVRNDLKVYISLKKGSITEIQEKLEAIASKVRSNELNNDLRFDEIETVFDEKRNDFDKHVVQEAAQVYKLWDEIKSLNISVHRILSFMHPEHHSHSHY